MVAVLSGLAGVLLTFLLENVKPVAQWYDKQSVRVKRLAAVGLSLVLGFAVAGLVCVAWIADFIAVQFPDLAIPCGLPGIQLVALAFVDTLLVNQTFYALVLRKKAE